MNDFIWTDLSTYYLNESVQFYSQLFGWKFLNEEGYYVGGIEYGPEVGIYETPDFFKKIKMPHFWMNYIRVKSLAEAVSHAESMGAKIEVRDDPFYGGSIALIRDPMGAGFTVYDGNKLSENNIEFEKSILSRELHTSDINKVLGFYSQLFEWKIKETSPFIFNIYTSTNKHIGRILEVPNELKGKYEYWVTEFSVSDLEAARYKLKELGGEEILTIGNRLLATDRFKEAFFYLKEGRFINK